ncbi:ABC transporter permease [Herbaspirillum seropedicae]|uniref:ABC-type sugar transport system, permease component protein n=1 Tax=Herbaspirillum seropedicae (strain SmR1) TaxID=757424 RepID=D8J0Y1_HERSS|nr:ABC transporter permease [Herbaspirillum seropedicae]ADJ62536.1 ABC-type sugar transport system, permease component protein [Herbaspirillum seropedicae SmR1]AKN64650.1 sugar ABC transporter permease [Herbaspirillum seropedicae]NQE30929.1 sugar ABC transporter permease [Herbaspirillum seropedicae]UMU20589.1 ABC transporter permease [Herbaspirillum seropedicae]
MTMKLKISDPQLLFLLVINVAILLVATVFSHGDFLDIYNFQSMASQLPELGLLAIGVALAMISGNGGIDLSGIGLANLAGVVAAAAMPLLVAAPDAAPWTYTLGFIAVALVTGLLGGALNGWLISRGNLTPILCTLGTQMIFTGLAVVLTNGSSLRISVVDPISAIGNESVLGVPIPFIIFVALLLLVGWLMRYSLFGIKLYLLGTNARAARYAGISQNRLRFATYVISGVLASVAGIIIAARTASVKADYGNSYLLIAILIAVMAGVRPQGGYGRMVCLFFSALALQLLSSTFNLLEISNFFRDCAWGLLLLCFLASARVSWRDFFPNSKAQLRKS